MSLVDLGKRLLEAAKQGLTDEVRTLMSNGAPFTTDWLGTSPLHFAAQHGHMSTAEVLLRAGISRDARTKVDRTPLHVAAQEGHHDVVDLLIKSGADIEAKDMLKMTPLHWSVEKGHVGVIELLLGHGADIHIDNKFDKSPVEIALSNGRSDLAELLQLSRMSQQNVVEVTTDHPIIDDVTETETIMGMDHPSEEEVISSGAINLSTLKGKIMKDADGSGDGEQSSTAVLATLAALAEATGPLNASSATNTTAAEALSWLESHGITMISSDTPTSLVESGQTLSLTEAGKLALDLVKQKVITVSTDQGELQTEAGTPMVIRINSSGEAVAEPVTDADEPLLKRIKLEQSESGNIVATTDTVSSVNADYVFTKEEPQDSLADSITTETIVSEGLPPEATGDEGGVTVEGGMIITEDGHFVTQEGLVIHEGGYGITVQSDLEDSQGVQIEEGYHIVHGQLDQDDNEEGIGSVPEGYCITGHAEGEEEDQGISSEEIQNFEVHQVVTEEELDGANITQEVVEGTAEDADAEEFRNRLDEITSKT